MNWLLLQIRDIVTWIKGYLLLSIPDMQAKLDRQQLQLFAQQNELRELRRLTGSGFVNTQRDVSLVMAELRTVVEPGLQEILNRITSPIIASRVIFTATIVGQPTQEDVTMLQLTDIQKCTLSVAFVDAKGNAAPVDGVPAWTVSDGTVLGIEPAADGMLAVITSQGPLGTCQVNVSADADLGAGVTTITGVLDVTVVASQATTVNIATGTPENQ
jgi:hypothetical protein